MENNNTIMVIGAASVGMLIGSVIHKVVNPIVTRIKEGSKSKRQERKDIERRLNALKEI